MKEYNHKKIEKKWQTFWDKKGLYKATDNSKKKKFYSLIEFPYPSGAGLHVGHIRSNTAMDIISRKRRMEGCNVLYPIGWDAFGLPTENYAIKTGKKPAVVTKKNTDTFRKQLKELGFSFDWSREVNTTDPKYYKWTQWIFLQLYKKGLAYKAKSYINWCLSCKIGLANEEVVDGKCERCGGDTEKREKEQWMLAITKYADRLDKDLDLVDYPERVKLSQRNWIGKSEGSELEFEIKNYELKIKVFTTRADTIFGATYVVLSPEHELISKIKPRIKNWVEVEKYIKSAGKKSELERTAEGKEKTGVEINGVNAINPATGEEIPIWIADYVLAGYGTGAIMAVPQHDQRDRDFAEKFGLPIIDKPLVDAKEITEKVGGKMVTKFKLRDWVFSRQRYWGEPIPIILCDKCGGVPVPEKDLPVELPDVKSYQPTDTGESPLANISKWVNVKCPKCKGPAKRETDTMPNWAGSSWYYLRYVDPKNAKAFADKKKLKYWAPVDWYNGGMEHTTLHLLYSRFWHKFLYDLKLVPNKEPYKKRTSHGMILGEGGVKMSKSLGNVINPDDIVKTYGADTLRVYEMFMGPFEESVAWSTESIIGSRRFIEKVWRISNKVASRTDTDLTRTNAESTLLYEDITYKIRGAVFAVKKSLGLGHKEIVYQKALEAEFKKVGLNFESQKTINVFYDDKKVGVYIPDFVVENKILVELKSLPFIGKQQEQQLWTYLKGSEYKLAMLVNFGSTDISFKRIIYDSQRKSASSPQKSANFSIEKLLHKTIKKVSEDIEAMRFNTAISAMMILANELEKAEAVDPRDFKMFLQILAPFAPHIAEELWFDLGEKTSIHASKWPKWKEKLTKDDEIKIAVQVNGKPRGEILIEVDESEESATAKALADSNVKKYVNGEPKRVIYVKNRIINILV